MDPQTVKNIRRVFNLSTAELGDLIGVSGRTVEGWEQGRPISRLARRALERLIQEHKVKVK